jgi:hypothetical protein
MKVKKWKSAYVPGWKDACRLGRRARSLGVSGCRCCAVTSASQSECKPSQYREGMAYLGHTQKQVSIMVVSCKVASVQRGHGVSGIHARAGKRHRSRLAVGAHSCSI